MEERTWKGEEALATRKLRGGPKRKDSNFLWISLKAKAKNNNIPDNFRILITDFFNLFLIKTINIK